MALARYEGVAVNLAGDVIPNATVEVRRDQPGRPVVPLWADRNGTVPLGNPITTDAEGKFGFHVTGGSYYVRIFTGPSQQPLQQYVRRYQAVGTAAERDVEDLATALEAGTATFPTLAELEAFTPAAEGVGGKVTTGQDAGFYHYDVEEEEWVFDRPLFDTFARMVVTGGTADAIEAETATGVADSAVVMLWIEAPHDNTGPVSINGKEVLTAGGNSLIAGQWNAGRTYWFSDEGTNYKLRTESDVDGIATQVEIWANQTLANKNYAEEWAQSDEPISVDAGGDGMDDKSSKGWAEVSADSAAEAAGYAAGLNIAPIVPGDARKVLRVNEDEDGSEWVDLAPFGGDAGSGGAEGLVPAPSPGDAAAKKLLRADGFWAAVSNNDSIISIGASKGMKSRLLLPSGFADGFCGTDGVAVASSNYVQDTAVGRVYPSTVTTMIPRTTGTAIGNATDIGGLAAAFDGVTTQGFAASARGTATGVAAYVGKNYSAAPKRIVSATVYATSDLGFDSSGSAATYDVRLYAKNGTAPANSTDGTLLAMVTGADAAGAVVNLTSSDGATAFDYAWVRVSTSLGAEFYYVAEAQFFTPSPSNMTLITVADLIDIVPVSIKASVIIRPFEAMILNTDLTLRLSRDGGVTWANANMAQMNTLGADRYLETAEISMSGQPSGSNITAEIRTLNNKSCEIRGLHLEAL
jgi:hypothetical protein